MFKNHEDAKNAIAEYNSKLELNGKVLFVSKHISKQENQLPSQKASINKNMKEMFQSNIYVRFIPKNVTQSEFTDTMSKAGKIISLKLKD
jgi:RNA recognition motif-containing protein